MRYALIENGIVANVIMCNPDSLPDLLPGQSLIRSDTLNIGDEV